MVKGTAKIKISSKREGEESETESYTSTPGQNEELGKDGDLQGVTSSNESMPQTPQQNIQSSSDIGSGQHQNPSTVLSCTLYVAAAAAARSAASLASRSSFFFCVICA